MASRINIVSIEFLDNPSTFDAEFKLEITFEAFEPLPKDLEWELVYVGSAESSEYDQVLDSVEVGPVPEGRHKFVFTAVAPKPDKIPLPDLVGVTVLLLRIKYDGQEFINLGWFVSNEYTDEELKENPPAKPILDKLTRTIQKDDCRVTTFAIKWEENQADEYPPEEPERVFDEQDLMPLEDPVDDAAEDNVEEESDDDEEEEDGETNDAEIDLDESAESSAETKTSDSNAEGENEEEMDVDSATEKATEASTTPSVLADATNGAATA